MMGLSIAHVNRQSGEIDRIETVPDIRDKMCELWNGQELETVACPIEKLAELLRDLPR